MACPLSQVAVLWPFLGKKDKLLRLKLLLREKNQHGSGGNPSKVVFFSMYFEVAHFHATKIFHIGYFTKISYVRTEMLSRQMMNYIAIPESCVYDMGL